jgi:Methyltransferase small domain
MARRAGRPSSRRIHAEGSGACAEGAVVLLRLAPRLARGGALDSAGKRAAFALFYAPQHLLVTREILKALPWSCDGVREVLDIGCGSGASGAAWALESGAPAIRGIDSNPWAVAEANWTYRELGLQGRAILRDAGRAPHRTLHGGPGTGTIAAYTVNELGHEARAALLERLLSLRHDGTRLLVIEPIARRALPWWPDWERAIRAAGGRSDEWRFPVTLPARQQALAHAAGLDPRQLTARSLYLPPRARGREDGP